MLTPVFEVLAALPIRKLERIALFCGCNSADLEAFATMLEARQAAGYPSLRRLDYDLTGTSMPLHLPGLLRVLSVCLPTLEAFDSYSKGPGLAIALITKLATEGCTAPNLTYMHLHDKPWGRP